MAYTISYAAFSVPAVAAGFASTSYGLHRTSVIYGVVVVALSLAALAAQRVVERAAECGGMGRRRATAPTAPWRPCRP